MLLKLNYCVALVFIHQHIDKYNIDEYNSSDNYLYRICQHNLKCDRNDNVYERNNVKSP